MLAAIETLTASFPQVFLGTSADDLDCTPGFQQRVLHIQQPAEFIEDQAVLNCKPSQDVPGATHVDFPAICNKSRDVGFPSAFWSHFLCHCLALGGCFQMTASSLWVNPRHVSLLNILSPMNASAPHPEKGEF